MTLLAALGPVLLGLLVGPAAAGELWLVRSGDTVASIASTLGVSEEELRGRNDLAGEPRPGSLLEVPPTPGRFTSGGALVATWGAGEVVVPGVVSTPFVAGTALPDGSLVCTGAGAFATVRLARDVSGAHDDVSLLGATCLLVASTHAGPSGRSSVVRLEQGGLAVRAAEVAGLVAVETAYGVAAGEGGDFRVRVEPGLVRAEALHRPAALVAAGVEVEVPGGSGSLARAGSAPEAPTPLPAPVVPLRPLAGEPLRVPRFAWTRGERDLAWRVEIAADPAFLQLVYASEADATVWTPDLLLLPFRGRGLWWRVAAVDRTGFLGMPSAAIPLRLPSGLGP